MKINTIEDNDQVLTFTDDDQPQGKYQILLVVDNKKNETLRNIIKILEVNPVFEKAINFYREKFQIPLDGFQEVPTPENAEKILGKQKYIDLRNEAFLLSYHFANTSDYSFGFLAFIVFNVFPISNFGKIAVMDEKNAKEQIEKNHGRGIYIHIQEKVSKEDLKQAIDKIWKHIEPDIKKLPKFKLLKKNSAIDTDIRIYQLRKKGLPYKKIKKMLDNEGEFIEEKTIRKKHSEFSKRLKEISEKLVEWNNSHISDVDIQSLS